VSQVTRVLVVEDDSALAQALQQVLGAAGGTAFRIESTGTLAGALARLAAGGIGIVLLDLGLPDGQGLDTLTAVQAAAPDVPVVVLAALDDEAVAASALRRGAQDYLVKGHLDVLPRALRYAVERGQAQAVLRRVEQQRRTLEEQFRQAQKMEAIGRLAGGVAHDFNNLLTVITGYSERLQLSLSETDPLRRAADAIRRSADRAVSLTQQLLAFSRRRIPAPRVFEPTAVIAGVQKLLSRMLGEDVRLDVSLAPDTGHVRADFHQIEQALLTLAVSSRDAMPDGGTLSIRTRNVRAGDDARLAALCPVDTPLVEVAVADTGCGMDEETLSHLIEPFCTTKARSQGTGLGLPAVYGIVEQSGGCVLVDSAPGKGTTFRIYLPRVDAPVTAVTEAARGGAPGGSETILLVEDDEPVRLLLRDVLRRFGYTVLDAPDGPEAEQASAAHDGAIHLLLTDMVMPRMNGTQVAASITRSRPGTRVLYMSGFTDHPLLQQGVANASVAFIAKPFTPDGLARRIREVLD